MKILKTVSIIVFIVSVILFGGYVLREKTGQDPTGPVISVESDHIEVSINASREALLAGVTASDARDGDLTAAVCVESVGPIDEEGRRIVRYAERGYLADRQNTLTTKRMGIGWLFSADFVYT